MTQVTNFKKGTVALAVLLVLVVAKTTNAVDFETSAVNGIDIKSAAGCSWALKTGNYYDQMMLSGGTDDEYNPGPESDVDSCMKSCANNPNCTHWAFFTGKSNTGAWVCNWLTDNDVPYDPIVIEDNDEYWNSNKSFCVKICYES